MTSIVMLLFVCLIMPSLAQTDGVDGLKRAEAAYLRGDYNVAVLEYETILKIGASDPIIYFNLANSYNESGDLGRALLNYRRVQQFWPRDSDLNLYIGQIYSRRLDFQGEQTGFLESMAAFTISFLTLTELSIIISIMWTVWFIGLGISILNSAWWKKLRLSIVVIGFCLALGLSILGSRLYIMSNRPPAVVIDTVRVMSGPGEDYLELFELHSGADIHTWNENNGWLQFALPDGRLGWIPRSAMEFIYTT